MECVQPGNWIILALNDGRQVRILYHPRIRLTDHRSLHATPDHDSAAPRAEVRGRKAVFKRQRYPVDRIFKSHKKSVPLQKQCMSLVISKSRHTNNEHNGLRQRAAVFPALERLRQQNRELGLNRDLASKIN